MIEFLSSWTKNLCLALIIVSILEMLLPNNKTKKYIKMIMGLYILFSIISPFIQNGIKLNFGDIDINSYIENSKETSTETVDQTSMDKRLREIYINELEKDITQKITEKGYIVNKCKVTADILNDSENSGITKINLKLKKETQKKESIEDKLVSQIQKIQKVDISVKEGKDEDDTVSSNLDKTDIEIIKKFLIEEYGVSEKCLEIN